MTTEHAWMLPQALAQRAQEDPDEILVQEVDGRSRTYGELHRDIRRWAEALSRAGVGAGDTVVTLLPNSLEAIHSWLGSAWLKAMAVPVNTMYRGQMLEYVINNSTARVVVVSSRYLDRLAEVAPQLTHLETLVVVGDHDEGGALPFRVVDEASFLAGTDGSSRFPDPEPHDISCIIYTSGTTGPSKGVLVPWRELYEFPLSLPPDTSVNGGARLILTPMFHVSGLSGLWIAVHFGIRMVLRETFSVSHFWEDVERYDCESTLLIGPTASLLLRDDRYVRPDNPLRAVSMGPFIPGLDEFRERFGTTVSTAYGMTEIGLPLAAHADEIPNVGTCGRIRDGYELRIIDENGQALGPGAVGELIVKTSDRWMLNGGYWNMPEATDAAWHGDWFHTGDAFMYDEHGFYYFVDRFKDALRRRGENISSFEVERYVQAHPDVAEAAAIAVPSDLTEDDLKIVVVLEPERDLSAEDLHGFLRETMPAFMVPRYIELADELPKTPTERVKKAELRARPLDERTWDSERGDETTNTGRRSSTHAR